MEQKYILSEGDIRNLSPEQQAAYNHFLGTIFGKGIVYEDQLESFDEILQQQYKSGVLFNPNSLESYPEILAKKLQNIIATITSVRNDVINGKRVFEEYDFLRINEGLEVLKRFTEVRLQSSHYIGNEDLKSLLSRIEQLESQIAKDMQFYQGYFNEKTAAIVDYRNKKAAYDQLSWFGKIAARINGRKKELTEAQQKNIYYNTAMASMRNQQPGDIVNPYQYDEYLERQQPEQSTGGKGR